MRVGTLITCVMLAACSSTLARTPDELVGSWDGEAQVVVSWCCQPTIGVTLEIAPDATVAGTVGDATLREARLLSNRGEVGRWIDVKTDWIVAGRLEGPLVRAEEIARDEVMIPFDLVEGLVVGGVHAGHGGFGGKESMRFTAFRMVLTRR